MLKIRPVFITLCDIQARSIAIEIINEVVAEEMSKINCEELVTYQQNEKGEVTMLKINSVLLNNLSSQISINIQKKFLDCGKTQITLPWGSILDNEFLANMRSNG